MAPNATRQLVIGRLRAIPRALSHRERGGAAHAGGAARPELWRRFARADRLLPGARDGGTGPACSSTSTAATGRSCRRRSRRSSRRPGTRRGSRTRSSATGSRRRHAFPRSSANAAPPMRWLHWRADTLGFDAGHIVARRQLGGRVSGRCVRGRAASGAAPRHRAGVRHLRRRAADRHVDQRRARPGRRDRRRDGSVDGPAPVLSRRGRLGRDSRPRSSSARAGRSRHGLATRRDPVHVARSSRPQPLRRGARPGRPGVAAVRRRPRAVRTGRPRPPAPGLSWRWQRQAPNHVAPSAKRGVD